MVVPNRSDVVGRSHTVSDFAKCHLSPHRQRLVALMQRLHFGTIHDLPIHTGEPVLDPPPRTVHRRKIGGRNDPRPQAAAKDFTLKAAWIEFFEELDAMGDGVIQLIEVAHGLPFLYEFEEPIHV